MFITTIRIVLIKLFNCLWQKRRTISHISLYPGVVWRLPENNEGEVILLCIRHENATVTIPTWSGSRLIPMGNFSLAVKAEVIRSDLGQEKV